jgi:hypothetical protein
MQTKDQRETTSGNSQASIVLIEEDKPIENTAKPEIGETTDPKAQLQALITQMKEL